MPVALSIITSPQDGQNEQLSNMKGKALECAGLMASAVGKEKFMAHAQITLDTILKFVRQTHDSTLRRYALSSAVRVASALKNEFLPILPELVPALCAGCKQDFGLQLIEAGQEEQSRALGYEVVHFHIRGEGTKIVQVNSSVVQEISTCVFVLYNFAHDLGESFAPYVPEVFAAISPLIQADSLEAVRNVAIVSLPHLIRCVLNHPQIASQLFTESFFLLLEKLGQTEDDFDENEP